MPHSKDTQAKDREMVDVEIAMDDDKQSNYSDKTAETTTQEQQTHSKWAWLQAAYHCLVTTVGTGILGFPSKLCDL